MFSVRLRELVVSSLVCFAWASTASAASNPSIQLLKQTPVSLFSFGLQQLGQSLQQTFAGENPPPFARFTAPLSGKMADITTVIYDAVADTITLNLVKIEHLPSEATVDDACRQAMAALRTFAGLAPVTGQLQPGMEASLIGDAFAATGTSLADAPADYGSTLDKSILLRFSGADQKRFICHAPLLGAGYTLDK